MSLTDQLKFCELHTLRNSPTSEERRDPSTNAIVHVTAARVAPEITYRPFHKTSQILDTKINIYIYHWRRKRGRGGGGARGACAPPIFLIGGGGGGQWYVCASPLLTPHFYFPLELYVDITLTNNYLAFFIYQLIILWTISINRHRWLLVNNHIIQIQLVYIGSLPKVDKSRVCVPPPPPPPTHTHFLASSYATVNIYIYIAIENLYIVLSCPIK